MPFEVAGAPRLGGEPQGHDRSTDADAGREADLAHPAHHVAEITRNDVARRGRRIVQPLEIIRAGQDRCVLGFIEREVLGRSLDCVIAPPAQKTRNADAFGHVLVIMPFVELTAPFWPDIVPDGDDGSTEQAHSAHLALRFYRNAVTPSRPSSPRRQAANAAADCSSNSSRGILRLARMSRLVAAFACGEQRKMPASTCASAASSAAVPSQA